MKYPTRDCFYGAQFDPGYDEWVAIKVYRDGVPLKLGRFSTEDEAEDCARLERESDLEADAKNAPTKEQAT